MPKLMQPVSSDERIRAREEIIAALDRGDIELGDAIRPMRREWTGLSQGRFGKIAGLSANTMSAVERNAESATVKTLNQIIKRFGMRLTLRQISAHNKLTEQELLKGLNAHTAHADELADPLPQELTPLEHLKDSVKHYDRPFDPVWDEFLGSSEGVSDDLIEDSGQALGKVLCNVADEPVPPGLRVAIKILDRWGCSPHEQAQILALSGSDSAREALIKS
jgi:DNA-binding XRE family transcriptional regulator